MLHRDWDLYDTRHVVFQPARMTRRSSWRTGYWRAYRDFYRWGSILRGACSKPTLTGALRHVAYAAGWKKFEPLWDLVIRLKRVGGALPILEAVLSGFGGRSTSVPGPIEPGDAPPRPAPSWAPSPKGSAVLLRDQERILDAHAEVLELAYRRPHLLVEGAVLGVVGQRVERLLADVDPGLDHEARTHLQRALVVAHVVHVHADEARATIAETPNGKHRNSSTATSAGVAAPDSSHGQDHPEARTALTHRGVCLGGLGQRPLLDPRADARQDREVHRLLDVA